MKETLSVSIAGIAFRLDKEAYDLLAEYLGKLERGYRENPDGPEITGDIESRIAELILGEQESAAPVGAPLVRSIIDQLGYPDDLLPDDVPSVDASGAAAPQGPLVRRLYRSSEGARLGGVCSGLAAYFNCDVLWIRLAFCLPVVLSFPGLVFHFHPMTAVFGSLVWVSLLLYLILWFCIPKARSPRQRLEMRGERITAAAIEQAFREDARPEVPGGIRDERPRSLLSELIFFVGRAILVVIKVVALFIGGVIGIVALALLVAALMTAVAGVAFVAGPLQFLSLPVELWSPVLVVVALLVAAIPLLLIGYGLLSIVFGLPAGRTVLSVSGGIWLILLIMLAFISVKETRRFIHRESTPERQRFERVWQQRREAVVRGPSGAAPFDSLPRGFVPDEQPRDAPDSSARPGGGSSVPTRTHTSVKH